MISPPGSKTAVPPILFKTSAAAEVLNRMGGTAVLLPGGEIMPSLQSGAIDATEWVGPWNDLAFGFHKITKFY